MLELLLRQPHSVRNIHILCDSVHTGKNKWNKKKKILKYAGKHYIQNPLFLFLK